MEKSRKRSWLGGRLMRTRVWLSHQSRLAKFIMTGLLVGVLYLFVFGANAKMAKSFDEATWVRG